MKTWCFLVIITEEIICKTKPIFLKVRYLQESIFYSKAWQPGPPYISIRIDKTLIKYFTYNKQERQ